MDPTEFTIQRGDSLERVDESSTWDAQENEDSSWSLKSDEMDTRLFRLPCWPFFVLYVVSAVNV